MWPRGKPYSAPTPVLRTGVPKSHALATPPGLPEIYLRILSSARQHVKSHGRARSFVCRTSALAGISGFILARVSDRARYTHRAVGTYFCTAITCGLITWKRILVIGAQCVEGRHRKVSIESNLPSAVSLSLSLALCLAFVTVKLRNYVMDEKESSIKF